MGRELVSFWSMCLLFIGNPNLLPHRSHIPDWFLIGIKCSANDLSTSVSDVHTILACTLLRNWLLRAESDRMSFSLPQRESNAQKRSWPGVIPLCSPFSWALLGNAGLLWWMFQACFYCSENQQNKWWLSCRAKPGVIISLLKLKISWNNVVAISAKGKSNTVNKT